MSVKRAHAEKQRHFADERVQVDNHRRPLRQPGDFDVDGDRRGAGAALGTEKRERHRRSPAVFRGTLTIGRAFQRGLEAVGQRGAGLAKATPVLPAGAHGPENLIGLRRGGDSEDRGRRP